MPAATRRRRSTTAEEPGEQSSGFMKGLSDRIVKRYGSDSVMKLSDAKLYSTVKDYIPICWGVDFAMHLEGAPTGRLITIVGAEASAKTSLAYALLAHTQQRGGHGVLIDTEYAVDIKRAQLFGVDADALTIAQPETTEEAIGVIQECIAEAAEFLAETGRDELITIVLDSAAGAPTKGEMEEKDDGGSAGAGHARLYSKSLRKITRGIAKQRICLVIINQEKENVSYHGYAKGDATKTMVADKPLSFHSSVILTTHRVEITKDKNKNPTGIRTRVRVKKNKNAAPFSEAIITITFKGGIDDAATILEIGSTVGVIKKDRGWYSFKADNGEVIRFQSWKFKQILADYPEVMDRMNAFKAGLADLDRKAEADAPDPEDDDDEDGED